MGDDLILGDDGRIHTGEVVRKMSATLMDIDCGAVPLRPVGPREFWWHGDPARKCCDCAVEGENPDG